MLQPVAPGLHRGIGIAATQPLLQPVAPGLHRGIGIAATQPLLQPVAPGLHRGIGIAATQPLLQPVAPGLHRGIGIAATQPLLQPVAPGLHRGIGIAATVAWWLEFIGTEPTCEVAKAAVAPAIQSPRINVLTAFMTGVLLNKSCMALSTTVVQTAPHTEDYNRYHGWEYFLGGII